MTTLTREAIEAASGRELDALCAEHLFGWRWWMDNSQKLMVIMPPADSGITRQNFSEQVFTDVTSCEVRPERFTDWDHNDLPRFSTSGDAMLSVLEKMRSMGWACDITMTLTESPTVSFWQPYALEPMEDITIKSDGPLPTQVARAALLAILSEKESI